MNPDTILAKRLLDPDDLGLQATPEIRDAARIALGRYPVEAMLHRYPHLPQPKRTEQIPKIKPTAKGHPPAPTAARRVINADQSTFCPECGNLMLRRFVFFGARKCILPACNSTSRGGAA